MQSVIMLSAIMLSIIMLSVIMLSVVAPSKTTISTIMSVDFNFFLQILFSFEQIELLTACYVHRCQIFLDSFQNFFSLEIWKIPLQALH